MIVMMGTKNKEGMLYREKFIHLFYFILVSSSTILQPDLVIDGFVFGKSRQRIYVHLSAMLE